MIGANLKSIGKKFNVFVVAAAISVTSALVPLTAPAALASPCPTGFTFTAPNCQRSFEYTGAMQTFTVPNGVDTVTAYVIGARGGLSNPAPPLTGNINNEGQKRSTGNNGGIVSTNLPVTVGQQLNLFVGGAGQAITGGWNGGGKGAGHIVGPRSTYDSTSRNPNSSASEKAGGGGGASDIRIGGTGLANRILVGGGGGGTGFGLDARSVWYMGGDANAWSSGQSAGNSLISQSSGKGGTQGSGGTGGVMPSSLVQGWCYSPNTSAGVSGQGGYGGGNYLPDPNSPNIEYCTGGGGGGGYFGGGGGMVAGGGAGSNYIKPELVGLTSPNAVAIANPPAGSGNVEGMVPGGNGRIIIAYRATTVIAVTPVTPAVSTSTTKQFDVTFAQAVDNFDVSDFSIRTTGAGASTSTGGTWEKALVSSTDASHYRISVSNDAATDGTVVVNVNAAGVTVHADNSVGIGELDGTATIDRVGPVPTSVTLNPSIIKASPVTVTAVFNEAISNLDTSKVTLGGTSGGWVVGTPTGAGTNTITIALSKSSAITSGQDLSVTIDAGFGKDTAQNSSSAASPVTANTDNTPPTATITHNMGTLTSLASMPYTVTFSKDVRWLKASNVASPSFAVTGTATGCVATPAAANTTNKVVTVNLTGCGNGTIVLKLLANSVEDLAGNTAAFGAGNAGPTADVTAASVTRDGTPPTVSAFTQLTTTKNAKTIRYSVVFSEPVTSFTAANIAVTGASGSVGTWTKTLISGTGTIADPYLFEVANSTANHGDVVVRVGSGVVTDLAGNPNSPSSTITNSLLVMPSVTLGAVTPLSKGTVSTLVPVALVPEATITDHGTGLHGIRIKISAVSLKTGDVLSFTPTAATGAIHASYYANGILDLLVGLDIDIPGAHAQATIPQWQAALRAVKVGTTDTGTSTRSFEVILKPFRNFSYDSQHAFVLYPQTGSHTTWTQAKAVAESKYLGTMQGYLPTILSAEENQIAWFSSMIDTQDRNKFWLGASDATANYTWKWVTGPESGEQFCLEDWFWHGCTATSGRYNNWQPLGVFLALKPNNASNYAAMMPAYSYWSDAPHDWTLLGDNVTNVLVEFGNQRVGDSSYNLSSTGTTTPDSTGPVLHLTADGGLIGGKLNYTLSANEEINCDTVTSADFTLTNVTSITVAQSGPKQCSIVATPSLAAGATGTVSIAAKGTNGFSVSDLSGNASTSLASPTGTTALSQSVTMPANTTPTVPNTYLAVPPSTGFTSTDPAGQAATNTALVNAKIVAPPSGAPSSSVSRDISDRPSTDIVKLADSITVTAGTKVDAALKANPARQATSEAWAYLQLKDGTWLALGKRALDANGLAKVEPMAFAEEGTYVIKIIIADQGTIMPSSFRRSGLRTAAVSGTSLTDIGTQTYDLTVNVTPPPSGTSLAVSNPTPLVTSVSSSTPNGTLTTGGTVSIQVTFDSAVTVGTTAGSPTLALNVGSSVGYATLLPSGSGSGTNTLNFAYTVRTGDTATDLDYTGANALVLNGSTIFSAIAGSGSNAVLTLPAPGATGSLSANKALVVDSAPPIVSFAANQAKSTSTTITYLVLGNEPINCSTLSTNTGIDFNLTNISAISIAQTDATTCTITATSSITSGSMGSSSLAQSNSFSIADANGVTSSSLSPSSVETLVNNGSTQAAVTSVTSSNNGTFGAGTSISMDVNFDGPVTVVTSGASPTLALNFNGTTQSATYLSGSGTNHLVFTYVIQPGDATSDLDYASVNALSVPSGSSISGSGGAAYIVLPTPGATGSLSANSNISTDTTAPVVSISAPSATANTSVVTFEVTADEAISCSSISTASGVAFTFGNVSSLAITQVDSMTCQIAATTSIAIGATGTSSLAAASNFAVADISGNIATSPAQNATSASIVVSPQAVVVTVPSVTSITSSNTNGVIGVGAEINVEVHFGTLVQVTGTPQLLLNIGPNGQLADYASGSSSNTLTFTYYVQAGDNVNDLDVRSLAGLSLNGGQIFNPSTNDAAVLTVPVGTTAGSLAANSALIVDTVAPTVILASSSTSTSSRTIVFTITGDEALDCSSLSTVDGVDFIFENLTSITISQASSRVCAISALSSLTSAETGTSGLSAAQTFAISDAHQLVATSITNPSMTVAMVLASAGNSGGGANGGSTSNAMPSVPSLPKESKSLSTAGGDSLAIDGEHLDGVTGVTAVQGSKEVKVDVLSSTSTRLVIKTPALLAGYADLIIETAKGSIIFKNALFYAPASSGSGGGTKPSVTTKQYVISGFAAGKAALTTSMKASINKLVKQFSSYRAIKCVGYTMGPTRSVADLALSRSRAKAACDFALIRNKSLKIATVTGVRETKIGAQIRRILIAFTK